MKKLARFGMCSLCLVLVICCGRNAGTGGSPAEVDFLDALEYRLRLRELYAFEPGAGLKESLILEELGRLEESICAAFQDLEFQYSMSGLSRGEVMEALGVMMGRVVDPESARTVLGLQAYMLGEYAKAAELLMPGKAACRFGAQRYYYLASTLRSGTYTSRDLLEFVELEPLFRNFGPYYNHLWKTMKSGGGKYSLDTAGPVLEKSVFLLHEPGLKGEAVRELARLHAQ